MLCNMDEETLSKLKAFQYTQRSVGESNQNLEPEESDGYTDFLITSFLKIPKIILYGIMEDDKVIEFVGRIDIRDAPLISREIEPLRGKKVVEIVFGLSLHYARTETGDVWVWVSEELPKIDMYAPFITPKVIFQDATSMQCKGEFLMVLNGLGQVYVFYLFENLNDCCQIGSDDKVFTQIASAESHSLLLTEGGDVYGCNMRELNRRLEETGTYRNGAQLLLDCKCKQIACGKVSSAVITVDNELYFREQPSSAWTLLNTPVPIDKMLCCVYLVHADKCRQTWIGYSRTKRIMLWGNTSVVNNLPQPTNARQSSLADTLIAYTDINRLENTVMFEWVNEDLTPQPPRRGRQLLDRV